MYAQKLMVDQALHEVEETPADEQCTNKRFALPPAVLKMSLPPEDYQRSDDEQIREAMEDAIPAGVQLEVFQGIDRIPAAEHVMPLQQLVKHDAIEKSAEAKAEEDPRRTRKKNISHVSSHRRLGFDGDRGWKAGQGACGTYVNVSGWRQ